MTPEEMKSRTKAFAVRVVRLVAALPPGRIGDVLGRQALRSGTAIGANYREAQRASFRKHFASFIEIAAREADETLYWLELIAEAGIVRPQLLAPLAKENEEILSILTAIGRSTRRRP